MTVMLKQIREKEKKKTEEEGTVIRVIKVIIVRGFGFFQTVAMTDTLLQDFHQDILQVCNCKTFS